MSILDSMPSSRAPSSRRVSTARSKSAMSTARVSTMGELLQPASMQNAGPKLPVPSLGNLADRLPTNRTGVSSVMSGFSDESARMDELAKVKKELEDALKQVKQEMKDGGATKSQFGASTARSESVMSSVSGMSMSSRGSSISRQSCSTVGSSVGSDWGNLEVAGINKKGGGRLATNRGRNKLQSKGDKPLVTRPMKKGGNILPAPSPSAFRHQTHVTSNQSEYKQLPPAGKRNNQGPTRAAGGKTKEGHKMFSKHAEAQVASSAITGSTVFATRVAA